MKQEWRIIEECPRYEISEYGQVRNLKTGRILKTASNGYGYPHLHLYFGSGVSVKRTIHRLVAIAFCEGYRPDLQVNHEDGNKLNNHYSNLTWVTGYENLQHSYTHNLASSLPIPVLVVETGEVYPGIRACARALNLDPIRISQCLRGIFKSHKGYTFCHVNE